jgi:hypothetical protein
MRDNNCLTASHTGDGDLPTPIVNISKARSVTGCSTR